MEGGGLRDVSGIDLIFDVLWFMVEDFTAKEHTHPLFRNRASPKDNSALKSHPHVETSSRTGLWGWELGVKGFRVVMSAHPPALGFGVQG